MTDCIADLLPTLSRVLLYRARPSSFVTHYFCLLEGNSGNIGASHESAFTYNPLADTGYLQRRSRSGATARGRDASSQIQRRRRVPGGRMRDNLEGKKKSISKLVSRGEWLEVPQVTFIMLNTEQ